MNGSKSYERQVTFELANVGSGPDSVDAATLAETYEDAIVVLLGSHYCSRSRELVRTLRDHYGAFRERGTAVVPVLPAIHERARLWDERYDLPFPLLVDPGPDGEFEVFEPLRGACDMLPAVVLCDCTPRGLRVVSTLSETNTSVPTIGTMLDRIDDQRF